MNSSWQSFLTTHGAHFRKTTGEVLDFGMAAEELRAAEGTVLVPLTQFGLIEVSGDDAKSFLHNQFTSDINHLSENGAQHSAWCSAKGRMLTTFVVWRQEGGYRLTIAAELREAIIKRLQMFVLRSKVRLLDASDTQVLLGVAGPQAEMALAAAELPIPDGPLSTTEARGCKVIRLDASRFLVVSPLESAPSLWEGLAKSARPVGAPVWRWLDIVAALPVVGGATREEFVPQMADFEKIGGVSFHKGCYPGQEVVARTQYLGKVKRHLYRAGSEAEMVAGMDLYSPDNPDQSIGKIVSGAPAPQGGYAALAVVQSNYCGNVRLGSREGPVVTVTAVNPCA